MAKDKDKGALEHDSLDHTVDNVNDNTIDAPVDSAVKAFDSPNGGGVGGGSDINAGLEDVAAKVEGEVLPNDPRVEARDIVRTDKTVAAAERVSASGFGHVAELSEEELINSVPAAPAAGQPLDVVAYEEYTAEVAAQNAEAAAAALKLSPVDRARRVQALQRVSAQAYEG